MELKVRTWRLVKDCIDKGTLGGIRKFLKYQEHLTMTEEQIESLADWIGRYIDNELDEWFVATDAADD